MNRWQFIRTALAAASISTSAVLRAASLSLHCTPSPIFPVPLTEGTWRSQPFPVRVHDYRIWLNLDRSFPVDPSTCGLEPPFPEYSCDTPLPLDLDWKIWDGTTLIDSWPMKPIKSAAWGDVQTSCLLSGFQGRRNGQFALEWNVKKDAGKLKDLHPRVQIVKNPGYWCWL